MGTSNPASLAGTHPAPLPMFVAVGRFGYLLILVIIVSNLLLQLLIHIHIHEGRPILWWFHLALAESLCAWSVRGPSHARAPAAFVRASGCAARHDAYGSAPERFGLAVLSLP